MNNNIMMSDETRNSLHISGQFVADHVPAMLAYWDKNLICRFANAAYGYWFGVTPEEMVNKITIKELLGEALYQKNLPYITAALNGHEQTFEREIRIPSGVVRQSIANYLPDIVNEEVKGFFVQVTDISTIKAFKSDPARSNELMSEQNNRLMNFAGIVSHNLRSYANNLESIVDLLVSAESEEERNELLHFLKGISREFSSTVGHLNEIVESQDIGDEKAQLISLHEYIEKSVSALGIQIKLSGAKVHNYVSKDITLFANPAYIESILLNLLTNALKYRQPNRELIVEFDIEIADQEFALRIKDNGMGINLKKHGESLFGMYKTFHGNADARGIGLFITKFQIESLGGRIEAESEEGEGTMFSLYFKFVANE